MFMISIPRKDLHLLYEDGCPTTVNGKPTVLRREGEYLCYDDQRCRLLTTQSSKDLVTYFAASDGCEETPHTFIEPAMVGEQFSTEAPTKNTKRVFVDIFAEETHLMRQRFIAELPADASLEEIQELSSEAIHALDVGDGWEHEDLVSFDLLPDLSVHDEVPPHLAPDFRVIRSEDGNLMIESGEL